MDRSIRVNGGFRLSGHLVELIAQVVEEISCETFGRDLSHTGKDCPLCTEAPADSPSVEARA